MDRQSRRHRFARFAPYYERIDTRRLTRLVHAHYDKVDPEFGQQLRFAWRRLDKTATQGIRRRDLANCLYFLYRNNALSSRIPTTSLPPVGCYTLGAPEPTLQEKTRVPSGATRNRKRKAQVQYVSLPTLEKILQPRP